MRIIPGILKRGIVSPKYILAIVAVLIVIMVGMGLYEFYTGKRDIIQVLQEEAISLAESISIMGDNSLTCFNMIEDLVFDRLMDNARILEDMDYKGRLTEKTLKELAEINNIYQIIVFNENAQVTLINRKEAVTPKIMDALIERITPLLNDTEDETEILFYEDNHEHFAVGIRRRIRGVIVVGIHSDEMLKFRRSSGIGNLVREIGENEGIEYIVLQDEGGLILASKNVTMMRRIVGDKFLEDALMNKWIDTRLYSYDEKDVLEVVSPFQINENSYGLFRIGLSMKVVRDVESRAKQRLILTALITITIGIISLSLLLINQNYFIISNAYERMKTYTGAVLENTADGIIVVDSKGIISVFNKAAEGIFKKSSYEAIGKSLEELNPEMNKILHNTNQETILKVSIGIQSPRLLSINTSTLTGNDEENDSIIAVIRDITETKLMEENIRRTEQLTAMGKLASAVAHEVRNPLNAISMIAQRLTREFKPIEKEDEYKELADIIKSESSRLNSIVEEFLQFARPPKLNRQEVDIAQLLDETISLIEAQAEGHGIKIEKIYPNLALWIVDREQIKQALLNILLNSIDAMPDGGILSINGRVDHDGLHINISDTGKGIPEENIPRIFDLYFTTKETGTGLGLSIVQRIIMEHGGWINVDSVLGKGTTFSIYLPESGIENGIHNSSN